MRWFDAWNLALDDALSELPESSECPKSMLASLMRDNRTVRKCVALVLERDRPVAVIALRRRGTMAWDTIGGGGVAPRYVAHAAEGKQFPALAALRVNVHLTTQVDRPPDEWVREPRSYPVFRLELAQGFEPYWKHSGHLNTVKQARNQTRGLSVEVDGAGAAEWIIRRWAAHWKTRETVCRDDLLVAAEHYQKAGRFHTVRLLDGKEPVSGGTFFVENGGLLLLTTFTAPEYRKLKAGTRLFDATFQWAAESGFEHVDMGVGHAYKSRWAPPTDVRWSSAVRPPHLHAMAMVVRRGRTIVRSGVTLFRRLLAGATSSCLIALLNIRHEPKSRWPLLDLGSPGDLLGAIGLT